MCGSDVTDSHFQRCMADPAPAIYMPLQSSTVCQGSLPHVPQPAAEERIECVLDAARVLAIWWGPGSISAKSQRIMDRHYLALSTKAMGVAYAFFRTRCSHVLLAGMAGLVSPKARIRHSLVSGWPWDMTRVVEYGSEIGRRLEWSAVVLTVTLSDEHSRIALVIPECLTRLKHCRGSSELVFFYYKSFFDLSKKNTRLFADEVDGSHRFMAGVWCTRLDREWSQICRGPNWDRLNQKRRSHVLSYIDHHPEFLAQLHDEIPPEAGILKASMACLKKDLNLEEVTVPKSMREAPAESLSGSQHLGMSGVPAVRDGRISKRHLKRVERRKQRSEQKKLEERMETVNLGI
ncbi:unnamed protein product [Heligmosomoides polygyrus]|uniref:DUF4338 domain-containing protein n=1 Tax=Heligmosomoides polygyrus TaxID=6339 RepID=A0A183GKQ4_HELPZ|nr:unnamed protein product [Heligmosomoides polygyrus]